MTASAKTAIRPAPSAELWRRIAVTLGSIAVFRLGSFIPVPGLLPEMIDALGRSPNAGIAFERLSIMTLGVMPWFNALIVGELLTLLLAPVRRWREAATSPRIPFNQAVIVLALAFAAFQSYGMATAMQGVIWLVLHPGPEFVFPAAMTILGGSIIAMWLAMLVTQQGIGSGFWVMLLAPAIIGLPGQAATFLEAMRLGQISSTTLMAAVTVTLLSIALVAALLYRRADAGHNETSGVVWPPLLAGALVSWVSVLPLFIWGADNDPNLTGILPPGHPPTLALMAAFIALCVWRYARLENSRPLAPLTAALLCAAALLPEAGAAWFNIPMILDGRWIVVLVAVLFSFARLWQRPADGTAPTPA